MGKGWEGKRGDEIEGKGGDGKEGSEGKNVLFHLKQEVAENDWRHGRPQVAMHLRCHLF